MEYKLLFCKGNLHLLKKISVRVFPSLYLKEKEDQLLETYQWRRLQLKPV